MRPGLAIAVLLVIAGSATAGGDTIDEALPPTLRFGSWSGIADIKRIDIERDELLWVSVQVAARFASDDAWIPIDVPSGTRILGMQVANDQAVVWSEALDPDVAEVRHARAIRPAIIDWKGTTFGVDHLVLRVDGVGTAGTTITFALELPAAMNLHVEPVALVRVDNQPMRAPIAVFPTAQRAAGRSVDANTSLVAGELLRVSFGDIPVARFGGSLDKGMIRRRVKLHVPVLRHCYELELRKQPRLAGRVDLHFTIGEDGHVSDIRVDGALPSDAVKTCMADELATWMFPPVVDGGATAVNYPLELVTPR